MLHHSLRLFICKYQHEKIERRREHTNLAFLNNNHSAFNEKNAITQLETIVVSESSGSRSSSRHGVLCTSHSRLQESGRWIFTENSWKPWQSQFGLTLSRKDLGLSLLPPKVAWFRTLCEKTHKRWKTSWSCLGWQRSLLLCYYCDGRNSKPQRGGGLGRWPNSRLFYFCV